MNGNRILAGEFAIAIAFIAWQDLKFKYLPWPATIARVCVAFGILGIVSAASEEFAAVLGGGFLLAGFLRFYQSKSKGPYAIPFVSQDAPYGPIQGVSPNGTKSPITYQPLYFGSTS